jgi:hypothetical protein
MKTRGNDRPGDSPIFIGGISFSGKTILNSILSAHPKIIVTRHTSMWPRYYQRYGELSQPNNFNRCLTAMLQDKRIEPLNPDPERIQREFWQGPPSYGRLFGLLHEHHAKQQGKARWGDQLSFIECYITPILACYPAARMIHMIRDPRERYRESIERPSRGRWKVGLETATWLRSARLAERNYQRYPASYKIVRYESLISDPEGTTRDICNFLREDFLPEMVTSLHGLGFGNKSDANSRHQQASESYSRDITEREILYIQMHTKRYMLANEYALKPVHVPLAERLLFYVFDWPANIAGIGVGNIYPSRRERSL